MDKKDKPPKEKRRNNEKRKEKSRDAARFRRSRETEIFTDLANALPLSADQVSQLDKASVMRLAISYLKVRDMVELVPVAEKEKKNDSTDGSMLLKSLEGFIVVLSPEGDFVYLSENVSSFLGIPQIDLMGQNIFEFSHPCDHDEIREVIAGKLQDNNSARSIFIRLKCTLTNKGRSVNLKSASYKVIRCTGHMLKPLKDDKEDDPGKDSAGCFLAVGQPIPHPSNIEAPLPRQTFLTKHGLDMKFIHADDEFMKSTLGYEPEDLLGKSVYEYHHAMDSDAILSAYKCLFSKGQCETQRYRFLAKTGGYIWVVTQATLIYDKVHKPQSIVSVNYVISGLECKDEIYSSFQIESVKSESTGDANNNEDSSKKTPEVPVIVVTEVEEDKHEKVTESVVRRPISNTAKLFGNSLLIKSEAPTRPRIATSEIFGPRTKDMSRGFLTFSEEKPGLTMLKDEPDDLTHLAPVAGDVCVPLDDHPFLTDMLNDILLKDNFAPLLTEEPSDPFISYRDHDPSPQLLSPNFSKTSDSLPSLSSPSDSLLDEDHMSTFMNLQMDDDSELALKAPYIPMDITDDLPLLMPSELMWSSEDKKKQVQLGTSLTNGEGNSSLAHLLSTSLTGKNNLKASELDDDRSDGQRDQGLETIFNEKGTRKSWTSHNNLKNVEISKTERTQNGKRSSPSNYEQSSKRPKCEPKEKMSSELLQQLMSNNHSRGRPKGKSNWLLDTGGQKAACISQPSDSVLMNLLDPPLNTVANSITRKNISASLEAKKKRQLAMEKEKKLTMRKNSLSLLESNGTYFYSFMDLTQHDYEVNAPVQNLLLQGDDLLTALEINPAFS